MSSRHVPAGLQPAGTQKITSQQAAIIGANIRALRRERGWSQARLGELMGWPAPSTVCAAEGRRDGRQRGFTADEVGRLARVFGVEPSRLTTRCAHCAGHPPAGYSCLACGARRYRRTWRPFSTAAAVRARMAELGLTAGDLADRAGMSWGTMKYFGVVPHSTAELERLSVALCWPPGRLDELLGDQPSQTKVRLPSSRNRPYRTKCALLIYHRQVRLHLSASGYGAFRLVAADGDFRLDSSVNPPC